MRLGRYLVIAVAVLLIGTGGPVWSYTGNLSTDAGGLVALNGWAPATLSWDITQPQANVYRFDYTLTVGGGGGISHMILETSDPFTQGYPDIFNLERWTGSEWVTFSPTLETGTHNPGPGNPDMPTSLYGVKFEPGGDYTTLRWRFDAYRLPVWGDFYAIDGGGQTNAKLLYNEGFARDDPTVAAHDGTEDNHILRPDSRTPELPASALLLVSMVPMGLAYLRGRRRKH